MFGTSRPTSRPRAIVGSALLLIVTGALTLGVTDLSGASGEGHSASGTPIDDSLVFDLGAVLASAPELAGTEIDISNVTLAVASVTPRNVDYRPGTRRNVYKSGLFNNATDREQPYMTDSVQQSVTRSYTLTNSHTVGASIKLTSKWETSVFFASKELSVEVGFSYNFSTAQSWSDSVTDLVVFPSQTTWVPPNSAYQIEEYYTTGTIKANLDVRGVLSGDVALTRCGTTVRVPVGVLLAAQRDSGNGSLAPSWVQVDGDRAIVSTTSQFEGDAYQLYVETTDRTPGRAAALISTTPITPQAAMPTSPDVAASSTPSAVTTGSVVRLRDFVSCATVNIARNGGTQSTYPQIADRRTELLGGLTFPATWSDLDHWKESTLGYTLLNGTLEVRPFNIPSGWLDGERFLQTAVTIATNVTSAHVWVRGESAAERAGSWDTESDVMVDYVSNGRHYTGNYRRGPGLAVLSVGSVERGTQRYGPAALTLGNGYVLDSGTLWYEGRRVATSVTDATAYLNDGFTGDAAYFVSGRQGFTARGTDVEPDVVNARFTSRADVVGPGFVLDGGVLYFRGEAVDQADVRIDAGSVTSAAGWIGKGRSADGTYGLLPRAAAITEAGQYFVFDETQARRAFRVDFSEGAQVLPGGYVFSRGTLYSDALRPLSTGIRTAPACLVYSGGPSWSFAELTTQVECLHYKDEETQPIPDPARPRPKPVATPVTIGYINGDRLPRVATVTVGDQVRPIAFPPTGDWHTVRTVTAVFQLDPELATIGFTSDGAGPMIDRVDIAGRTFEAESGANILSGSAVRVARLASGGLAVGKIGADTGGGSLTMILDAGAPRVPVTISYTGSTTWLRAMLVSGSLSQVVAFPPVARNTVGTVTVELPLPGAPAPITIRGTGTQSPCVDKLAVGAMELEAESPISVRGSKTTLTTTTGANPIVRACGIGAGPDEWLTFPYDPGRGESTTVRIDYSNPDKSVRTAWVGLNGMEQLVAFGPSGTSIRSVTVPFPISAEAPATVSFRNPDAMAPKIDRVTVGDVTVEAEDARNEISTPAKIAFLARASGGLVVANVGKGAGLLTVHLGR